MQAPSEGTTRIQEMLIGTHEEICDQNENMWKRDKKHLIHIIKKGLWCEGMLGLPQLAITFLVHVCWQNVLELLQRNDSNHLNGKELMHKAWLNMIKLNAPTHQLKKWDIRDKQNYNILKKNQERWNTYLFKSIIVVNNSTSPWDVSSKIKLTNMCQDGSWLCNLLMYLAFML